MNEPLDNAPNGEAAVPAQPRTQLGSRLQRIRQRIIASGAPLLSWTAIDQEIAVRRGEVDPHG